MNILFYNYIELPKKVRLISKALCLDHVFYPNENCYYDAIAGCSDIGITDITIGIEDLFVISKTDLFDNVFCYLDEVNHAYFRDNKNKKIYICGWIDIKQFINGGHFTNDQSEK